MAAFTILFIVLLIAIKEQIDIHTFIHKHKKETEEDIQQFRNKIQKLKDILH